MVKLLFFRYKCLKLVSVWLLYLQDTTLLLLDPHMYPSFEGKKNSHTNFKRLNIYILANQEDNAKWRRDSDDIMT